MADDLPPLLACTICPKLPSFSDTSHLLTHVGSKGHLSHLHKLQVRSHQEISAGAQLATYNQWYQDNGLGQLLSERMLMKEAKQAGRRAEAMRRGATVTSQSSRRTTVQSQDSPVRRRTNPQPRGQRKSTRKRRARKEEEDDSDYEFSLPKRTGQGQRRSQVTPTIRQDLACHVDPLLEQDAPAELEEPGIVTPEHNKLKGTVWPGMALFDAATDDMRRMRNQKKDGSVLRKMARLSALVEPTEAVYTSNGELRKERHIDDLEDNSSLIDGESPVPKVNKTRSRKRQALAIKDENAPRLVACVDKVSSRASRRRTNQILSELPPLPSLPSSSTVDSFSVGSRFLSMDETDNDLKMIVPATSGRRRPPQFSIFTDGSPTRNHSLPSMQERNPFYSAQQSSSGCPRQQSFMLSAPWLQPQPQASLPNTNPYTIPRLGGGTHMFDTEKENLAPFEEVGSVLRSTNPLTWRSPLRETQSIVFASDSPFGNFLSLFPSASDSEDPFVATKNPLVGAVSELEDDEKVLDEKITVRATDELPKDEMVMATKLMTEVFN